MYFRWLRFFFLQKNISNSTRTTLLWWINNINVFIISNTSCIQIKTILSKVSKMVFNCFFSPIFFSSSCSFWDHQGITFSFVFLAWCLLKNDFYILWFQMVGWRRTTMFLKKVADHSLSGSSQWISLSSFGLANFELGRWSLLGQVG